jgi:hypothetical protein
VLDTAVEEEKSRSHLFIRQDFSCVI